MNLDELIENVSFAGKVYREAITRLLNGIGTEQPGNETRTAALKLADEMEKAAPAIADVAKFIRQHETRPTRKSGDLN